MASITHKRTDKDGKDVWLVRVCVDGRQVAKTVTGTRKQAERVAYDMESARDAGEPIRQSKMSVGQYMEDWLETYHRPEVAVVTYRTDYDRIKKHIIGNLGDKRLSALHTLDCQRLVNSLAAKGQTRTAVLVFNALKKSMRQAKRLGLITRNPMDETTKPKDRPAEKKFLSIEQVNQLLDAARGRPHYAVIAFLVLTGTRPEEAIALRWSDIDTNKMTVSINRAVKRRNKVDGGGWYFADLKTVGSARMLDVGQSLVDILQDHRREQTRARLIFGSRWQNHDLVFTSEVGGPADPSKIRKELKKIIERTGLPPIKLYGLRHSHGSMLLEAGTHIKTIADRLGHANPAVTLKTYLHVAPSVSRAAVDGLEAAMSIKKTQSTKDAQ